jgi:hypothetical protein
MCRPTGANVRRAAYQLDCPSSWLYSSRDKSNGADGNEEAYFHRRAPVRGHRRAGSRHGLEPEQSSGAGLHDPRSRWRRGLSKRQLQRHRQREAEYRCRRHAQIRGTERDRARTSARAILERMSPDCEPVHICSAWRLCWGFQGPRRRRDTTFRARRRIFLRPCLPCPAPCQPATVSHQLLPVALSDRSAPALH